MDHAQLLEQTLDVSLGYTNTTGSTPMPIDTTIPQVQAALISFAGIILSIVSTIYLARRNIHKDARSRARVEWNVTFRSAISALIAAIDQLRRARIDGKEAFLPERATDLIRAKLQILLLLDSSKEHQALERVINKVSDNSLKPGLYYDPEPDLAEVLNSARKIIAEQWRLASSGK